MSKFIILDRDGTLNVDEKGYTHKVEDFKLHEGVIEGLNLLKGQFKFIIVTNQSGIGRGYYKKEDFDKFNERLVEELKKQNITIEKTYCCPHTKEENCNCRKPKTEFIDIAKEEFNIDLEHSFMIGDHPCDVNLGKNAGTKTIFLLTGHGQKHKEEITNQPDFIANNLLEAARWILR
jgi:histidinol-phosphate phosphatase family protein